MKSVRIANSVKYIEQADHNVTLFRIQEVLSEHRSTLIMRILSDLPTYLKFKSYAKVGKGVQDILKDKLFELSNSKINLDRYDDIVQGIKSSNSYRVPSHQFFEEIDALLEAELNPSQLALEVK
jgi:hypothetical protein